MEAAPAPQIGPAGIVLRGVARAEFAMSDAPWPFAQARRAEIDAHFARARRDNPALWNGTVLLARGCRFSGPALAGEAFRADYASFLAWLAWGAPDAAVRNVFAAAAVQGSDGGFLLGAMAAHTAHAGEIYFPCGTPDLEDIADDCVDFDASAYRELAEETGLRANGLEAEPGWIAVSDGPYLALIRRLRAAEPADVLRARMLAHLAAERQPELSDVVIARGEGDIVPAMPRFVQAFLRREFAVTGSGIAP